MAMTELRHFEVAGRQIAYRLRPGSAPALVFLPGYGSDMEGTKALALDASAGGRGLAMLRFDYSGTGSSLGKFADGTWPVAGGSARSPRPAYSWAADPHRLVNGRVDLASPGDASAGAGSGADRIAAAPDFTDWGFTAEQAEQLEAGAPFSRAFWESGQRLLLLDKEIAIDCPVRLPRASTTRRCRSISPSVRCAGSVQAMSS